MIQCKVKDNSTISKEELSCLSALTKKVADKTLEQLEREGIFVFPNILKEADDVTKDQMILQSYNDSYKTSNVMGFLGVGNERLIVESRFSTGENDFLFQYLLEKVLDFPNIINLEIDANDDERMYDLLLFLFPSYLEKAMRKGVFKTYIRKKYNDENVKGTIDIARHIRNNIPFTGAVAYSQREYSYDNALIELIRHTIEHIKQKPYGNRLLSKVKDEVKLIEEATPSYAPNKKRNVIEANKKNTVRHAYYSEYRALQKLCILILQNQKQQLGSGEKRVYGILFDGAWLWEEYINSVIGDIFYHPMNKAGKGSQWLFSGNTGLIYPDFISKDSQNRVIADAKYKPVKNIGNKDYLQMLAYMFRFDAEKGVFLYPEANKVEDIVFNLNKGTTYEGKVIPREDVLVIKHGFMIPSKAADYKSFISMMEQSEHTFREGLLLEH